MPSIVVFYHPGGEHQVSSSMLQKGVMPWSDKGASYSNPHNGMYSFVPCKISDGGNVGFSRAVLTPADFQSCTKNHILSNGPQTQGRKITEVSEYEAKQVWECVRSAIHRQQFLEGFNFEY